MSRPDQITHSNNHDSQSKDNLAVADADNNRFDASSVLSSFVAECQAMATGVGSGVAHLEEERGYFSKPDHRSTEPRHWWMDPAAEASLAAAGGLAAGLAVRSYPTVVNAVLAGGVAAFAVVNRDQILEAGSELGQGMQIAWNGHNPESIKIASQHVSKAVDSPLFDLALVGGVGSLMKAVGPSAFDRVTFQMTDEISPLRGSNFAENYFGKRLSRGPFYFTRLGNEGKVEYVEDIHMLEPGANRLHLNTEPNIRLEPTTLPADQELGLGGYTGPFEHPTLHSYKDVSNSVAATPVLGSPETSLAVQRQYERNLLAPMWRDYWNAYIKAHPDLESGKLVSTAASENYAGWSGANSQSLILSRSMTPN